MVDESGKGSSGAMTPGAAAVPRGGEIAARIRVFLGRHLHAESLSEEDDIFAAGWVNSLFAMQLVLFLEKEFGIGIDNQDLERANFRSIRSMTDLVGRKRVPR
ncbi:MAG: phosphopantetheine-binding protein [Candidatus Eisenbacteria bacterium]